VAFFLFVHGVHGRASDLTHWLTVTRERFPDALCLVSSSNEGLLTHDGLGTLAERLAAEVQTYLGAHTCPRLPFVGLGHSFGGVILRAALPRILADNPCLVPCSYFSLQSPHLGSRRPAGFGLWGDAVRTVVHGALRWYGPSGQELLLQDAGQIIHELAKPQGPHMEALRRFPHITFVAIPHGDLLVPYASAAATAHNPFPPPDTHHPPFAVAGHSGFIGFQEQLLDEKLYVSSSILAAPPATAADPSLDHDDPRDPIDPAKPLTAGSLLSETPSHREPNQPSAGDDPSRSSWFLWACPVGKPTNAEGSAEPYSIDTAHQVEYNADTLDAFQTSIPLLRRLAVQFAQTWPYFVVHNLPICCRFCDTPAAREFVRFVLDLVALDLRDLQDRDKFC